jgi:hypothetical protein
MGLYLLLGLQLVVRCVAGISFGRFFCHIPIFEIRANSLDLLHPNLIFPCFLRPLPPPPPRPGALRPCRVAACLARLLSWPCRASLMAPLRAPRPCPTTLPTLLARRAGHAPPPPCSPLVQPPAQLSIAPSPVLLLEKKQCILKKKCLCRF